MIEATAAIPLAPAVGAAAVGCASYGDDEYGDGPSTHGAGGGWGGCCH